MFVREKTTSLSTKIAVQLVDNVRINGKVKQNIIRHFGYAENPEELQALKNMALKYKSDLEHSNIIPLFKSDDIVEKVTSPVTNPAENDEKLMVDLKKIVEEKRIKVGFHQVFNQLFQEIGLTQSLKNFTNRKVSTRILKDIIISRISQPASKRSQVRHLNDFYGINVNLDSVYRMMDLIDDKTIDEIQKKLYENTLSLLGNELDIIFYDCTTLHFESFKEDGFRNSGMSKAGKHNQDQVLLALMVTKQGLPIGYEVYPGNTFEGNTLSEAINKLHAKFKIDKVIFVADAAMISRTNVKLLQSATQSFIVGARIKSYNKATTEQILDFSSYKCFGTEEKQNDGSKYKEIFLENNQRLIVTYSPKRAAKDKADREKAIEKAKKAMSKSKRIKSQIKNSGYRRFLSLNENSKYELNEEKIREAERWDGLHGVVTDIHDISVNTVLMHYRGLWQVEETFRISKHNMQIRPIFHGKPERIKSHIAICFIALALIRLLEYKVGLQYKKMSPEEIRYNLAKLEVSILHDKSTNLRYILPSQATQDSKKIYQILGLKWREIPYRIEK